MNAGTIDGAARARVVAVLAGRVVDRVAGAGPDAVADGLAWYRTARSTARALAREHGTTLATAAGVVAALSPRNRWSVNVSQAARVLEAAAAPAGRCPRVSTTLNRERAWRIARGERPLDVLGGPKVRSFYRNIVGDRSAVTVDVWAARVVGVTEAELGRIGGYELVADAYRAAGVELGWAPCDVQAVAWVAVRGAAA